MKYIILPVLKFLFVVFALLFFPVSYLCGMLLSFWHWDMYYISEACDCYFKGFVKECIIDKKVGEKYYVYMTPWDYLISKKTFFLV
jgi:hypothetical protein